MLLNGSQTIQMVQEADEEKKQEEEQVEMVGTSKEEKIKSLAVLLSSLICHPS